MTATAPFSLTATLDHAWKKSDGQMCIGGIVSTAKLDKQDEEVVQRGLDFNPFLEAGWYNDDHKQDRKDLLGYPTAAYYVRKGQELPDDTRAKKSGWWTEGYLLDTAEGRQLWEQVQALRDTPRKFGFSIEGSVLDRDPTNRNRILRAVVRNVAITHRPVNTDTELVTLAKALQAGGAVANPGAAPGEGFALRGEALEGDEGDLADANKAAGNRDVADELTLLDEWGAAVRRQLANPPEIELTKSEARIVVHHYYPHLRPEEVDFIIERS